MSGSGMNNQNSEIENRKSKILEERARALARLPAKEEVEGGTLHLVTFPLGEERYGVEITLVQEIQSLESQAWTRVPCTPHFIFGAVNIRGRIYSVMDIARFLGLPSRAKDPVPWYARLFVAFGSTGGSKHEGVCLHLFDHPPILRRKIDHDGASLQFLCRSGGLARAGSGASTAGTPCAAGSWRISAGNQPLKQGIFRDSPVRQRAFEVAAVGSG